MLNNPSPTATAASSAPTPTNTPAAAPPSGPSPTTGAPPPPATCANNAAFVTDVSVPDGTVFAAGQAFSKTWKLSSNGTCAWGVGYQLVFVSGEAMTSSTVVAVPATNPGAMADILVAMTAPAAGGNHAGTWRMRSATGAVFGQSVTVKVSVLGAPPPPGAPPVPSSGCTGTPAIASFTASAPSVPEAIAITVLAGTTVTLHWGQSRMQIQLKLTMAWEGFPPREQPRSQPVLPARQPVT